MIKKGIELQIISPSLLFMRSFSSPVFSECSVCRSRSLFLCHMMCKFRKATYDEFCEYYESEVE